MDDATWTCDTCGGLINYARDGWVEWLSGSGEGPRRCFGMRLVHHYPASPRKGEHRCQYDEGAVYRESNAILADVELPGFLGPDGLMDLLAMIYDQEFANDNEVLEMIKRLHVPGYEKAFRHFGAAIAEGVFAPNTAPGFYSRREIEATIKWAETRR